MQKRRLESCCSQQRRIMNKSNKEFSRKTFRIVQFDLQIFIDMNQNQENIEGVNLIDIQQTGFNAENLLQIILLRDKLVNGLMRWLQELFKHKWFGNQQNQLYIRVLKICVAQYGYYQLQSGYNFIAPESDYAGISNQFYKIFETENDYKEQIYQFKTTQTRQSKFLKEELEKRMKLLLKWKSKFMNEFEYIKTEIKGDMPDYIKFQRFIEQIELPNQKEFDIYQYYFKLFYSEEWFQTPINQNSIELLKLYSFIKQFLRLDTFYPIEYYSNQLLFLQDINENEKQKEYYIKIIQQQ
ncbi:unnamed protein product [Paramecium sonneborni]|uniref:Uncharacterized protein n=1 Tax=Paramecium sonneborni TaxID=65129 RepID=A0A8S1QW81_9CILI|nr:unnamed protein product [Paramecium sonneborni]